MFEIENYKFTKQISNHQLVHFDISEDEINCLRTAIFSIDDLHCEETQALLRQAVLEAVPRLEGFRIEVCSKLSITPHFCILRGIDWKHQTISLRHRLAIALSALIGKVSDDNAYDAQSGVLAEDVRPMLPSSRDVTYRYNCEVHCDENSKPLPEDVVSLWCVAPAHDGGASLVWTVSDVVNSLQSQKHGYRILKFLREHRFPFGGKLRQPPRVLLAPILFGVDGIRFRLGAIKDAYDTLELKPTAFENEALEALINAIKDTHPYEYKLAEGEAIFLLNRRTLHARSLFQDPNRWLIKTRIYNQSLSNSWEDKKVSWWES